MNLKELLDIAKRELGGLTSLQNADFRLEQAEYNKEEKMWDIVISFLVENTNPRNSALSIITSEFQYHRIYKRLTIDDKKNVIGFYIYEKG